MLGLASASQTTKNVIRSGECVLNLPSELQVGAVDALARTTGSEPVPDNKVARGYTTVRDKFALAGVSAQPAHIVRPPRVAECPAQMEATVAETAPIASDDPSSRGFAVTVQVSVERLHIDESLLLDGDPNRVDPSTWRPLIMSFAEFYGLRQDELHPSELAAIPQSTYVRAGAGARNVSGDP